MSCAYFRHHNWAWVVERALEEKFPEYSLNKCESWRELPSQQNLGRKEKARYALFRIELVELNKASDIDLSDREGSMLNTIQAVWASLTALEYLDPKDALYRALLSCGTELSMPATSLIPWDCDALELLPDMPAEKCLLKASLGSGGYGLYFVNSKEDVLTVIRNHAAKARSVPGFVSNLIKDYGDVPSWSLQTLINSYRLNGGRKCQFRAYVVLCGTNLYLYQQFEVRLPLWDASCEELMFEEDELVFCQGSNARPYNHGRRKVHTERALVEEFPELTPGIHSIDDSMRKTFIALRPSIEERLNNSKPDPLVSSTTDLTQLAIAGVDLLLDSDLNATIVEINNNPAMPGEAKNMTDRYKEHLISFVADIFKLGLGRLEETKFELLW